MEVSKIWNGIVVSAGIAVAKSYVFEPTMRWKQTRHRTKTHHPADDMQKLKAAIERAKVDIWTLKRETEEVIGMEESRIFDAHVAMLDDPFLWSEMGECIEQHGLSAASAMKQVAQRYMKLFEQSEDPRLRERVADIYDIANRVLMHLLGEEEQTYLAGDELYVLIARDITPSQFVKFNSQNIQGIITVSGGYTSHTAIMARALHIPFVMVYDELLLTKVRNNEWVIVNGHTGQITTNPTRIDVEHYVALQAIEQRQLTRDRQQAQRIALTEDGHLLTLYANITSFAELETVWQDGAEGIGLFRTEFLFMQQDRFPTEEEQFYMYRQVAIRCQGKPLTIRTIDIGGDKFLPYFVHPKEDNPAMGYRSIRISLAESNQFHTQLRAILRASAYGDIRLLLPMISHMEQLREIKQMVAHIRTQLTYEGIGYRDDLPIGMMIEVPAAAWMVAQFCTEVNFMSIGTNDLTQFVLAADRMNERVAHLYNPYHPAMVALLHHIAEETAKAGIPLTVCGELAGEPLALPLWLSCRIQQLSMSSRRILPIKQALQSCNGARASTLKQALMCAHTATDVQAILQQHFSPCGGMA